ncbi:MAG: DUF1801 domain-containing protein [Bacteroidetes bacterium]|nr:MAG: DUF1801 domain-containing protein [Bacteroidota bacterium]
MTSAATSVEQYLAQLPEDRQHAMTNLRQTILANLPSQFTEQMSYGMIGYVVPHSLYPSGYHCSPKLPLPFISLASQKSHIAVYHMGLYAMPSLLSWFTKAYQQQNLGKLDLGKSCIRFKNPEKIPFSLLGQLATKVSVEDWIAVYESSFKTGK